MNLREMVNKQNRMHGIDKSFDDEVKELANERKYLDQFQKDNTRGKLIMTEPDNFEEAKRHSCGVRFDLIPPEALIAVAKVFAEGAEKYGDINWQKSRLQGEHGPINHALKHIVNYSAGIPDDDGDDLKAHLSHAIVNLMFEYWHESEEEKGQ